MNFLCNNCGLSYNYQFELKTHDCVKKGSICDLKEEQILNVDYLLHINIDSIFKVIYIVI